MTADAGVTAVKVMFEPEIPNQSLREEKVMSPGVRAAKNDEEAAVKRR